MKEAIFSRNAVYETLAARRPKIFKIQISEVAQDKGRLKEIIKRANEQRIAVERVPRARLTGSMRITRAWLPRSAGIPTIAGLQPVFAALKARLVPLLKRITQSRVQIDDGILRHSYDQARQLEFGRLVLIARGYDFERGRLDLSTHPFTTSFHATDVRVTTRVHEHELQSCLSAVSMKVGMGCMIRGWSNGFRHAVGRFGLLGHP